MLLPLRACFNRKCKRPFTKREDGPPPYDCQGPTSEAVIILPKDDPAVAATYIAVLSAQAITARAIAETWGTARALKKARHRIHTTVLRIIRFYGLEHDHRLVESIWAGAISSSAATARDFAQWPKRSSAIDLAREIEEKVYLLNSIYHVIFGRFDLGRPWS